MLKGQNIFLTGATGFIGRHLALALAGENNVTALVRGPRKDNKDKDLLASGIKIVWGDYTDSKTYAAEIVKADYVFHFAALFTIEAGKDELYKANVLGTKTLLEACKGTKIKKIVYSSTAYVSAGRRERDNIAEDEPYADDPRNWYEWSKAESEKDALRYYQEQGVPVVIIRPATVYGPGNLYAWFVAFNLFAHNRGALTAGGRNKIHFVSVFDVAAAAEYLADKEGTQGQIYTICDEHPYSQREAIVMMRRAMNIKFPLLDVPKWVFKLMMSIPPLNNWWLYGLRPEVADFYMDNFTFSNQKLKKSGFTYQRPDFKDGLEETVRWYAENKILPIKCRPASS
ncbi:MAG: NAD-dependent epimerase/dehydratase family protein [Candidatus Omnitrophica bacterium]|nr:NAD-dependent epimerase/dehydratase family protein [Candidatus Omnitrophota bacterium]